MTLARNPLVAAQRLGAAAWGLFFVWIGVALIANVGWGLGLVGVGVITLGGQVARRYIAGETPSCSTPNQSEPARDGHPTVPASATSLDLSAVNR